MQRRIMGLIVTMCLLVSGVAALVPDQVDIASSGEWVVANGADTATITVKVQNCSSPIPGLRVDFSTDPVYGQMTPLFGVADASGEVFSTFKAALKSGIAPITVRIHYEDNGAWYTMERVFMQSVDHDAPFGISYISYLPEVTVGGTSLIVVGLSDMHGNPVDDRNVAEEIRFTVGSPAGNAGFDSASSTTRPVDHTGNASASLQLDTVAGENIVLIEPPTPVPGRYITISGLGNGVPSAITCAINSTPYLPADGVSKFHLTYTLNDQYGNPAGNRSIWINTSIGGEDRMLTTNSLGQVKISYGPKDSTGTITLTATAIDNSSVTIAQQLEFHSTAPVNMLLSASPQTMASRDVNPDMVANIRAKVMDIKGNPVSGESVSFSIIDVNNGTYIQTGEPELVDGSALTDGDGYAIVGFRPGEFTRDWNLDGYDDMATGTCSVAATWAGNTLYIPLAWKNYPYLSVETEVVPETVEVNDTIDVTIRLKGDGWALQPDPIDIILCTDRSGSMLYDNPDRMYMVREAAKNFINQMSESRDRIGTVSFGRNGYISRPGVNSGLSTSHIHNNYVYPQTYSDYATVDNALTQNFASVRTSLNSILPDHGTPLRHGLKVSLDNLIANSRDDAVKAIVLLTDGDYNWYGDPLARGTGYSGYNPTDYGTKTLNYYKYSSLSSSNQNMAYYASNNPKGSIRIYTISYSNDISSFTKETLRTLAESTGGKYYNAPDPSNLGPIYTEIAGELKTEAGVNTGMSAVFENVEVNGAPAAGNQVFEYVYADLPPSSTRIHSYNDTATLIPVHVRDDTESWLNSQTIHFDIGTITLNQTWETTFRFKVLKDGNINIFGPGSIISFNDGMDTLTLPDTFVTAVPDLNNTGVNFTTLEVMNLRCTNPDSVTEFMDFAWDLEYTGMETVTEELFYSNDGGLTWVKFDTRHVPAGTTGDAAGLDVRSLPVGQYIIRLRAFAPDAPDDRKELVVDWLTNGNSRNYIRIQ